MKRILANLILTILCSSSIYPQNLSLNDLKTLCSKKNWEDVNQTLLAKNWIYDGSEKGSTYKYNTITWSFKKDYYSNKAKGWFYLYTYEGYPNKISYSVFNKESYSLIQNSIASAGFKLINSEIEDNEIISTYSNSNFTLIISTEKRKENDFFKSNSITAYTIDLIKKAGVYDPHNGKKTDYYDGDIVKAEYTLLNGEINGEFKVYHYNGKLMKVGSYTNGLEDGLFQEYDDEGKLIAEYVMSKGKKNGVLKIYEDGKIDVSTAYKDGVRHGEYIEYYYNDETGNLQLKQIGNYLNNEKNGTWELFLVDENNTENLLKFENYSRGIRNGAFQDIRGDSLIIGNYKNDLLSGEYKVYLDPVRMFFGGTIRTDTAELTLLTKGYFYEDRKTGYWKNYDFTNTLRSEGMFRNGQEIGEWKYYYTNWGDDSVKSNPYSKQLYLILNYSNGKLEGKSTRYSYLEQKEFPCSEIHENKSPLDTCKRFVFEKVLETKFYKNDKLNGPFELRDSVNRIIAKGNFKDDLKDGEWVQSYSYKNVDDEIYFIYQKGNYTKDKRDGKWIQYYTEGKITETFNYKNGELHGEYIALNNHNKPREKKYFNHGKLTELITYDSLGIKPIKKYEIYDYKNNSFKCRRTVYAENWYSSQEYFVKNEDEINHNYFELLFRLFVGEFSDGTKGYKDGIFNLFNSENQPIVTGEYYKEDRIGLWTFYYYDQNVKIQANYSQDKQTDEKYLKLNGELFSGKFVYFDNENGTKEERKIKNGLRSGKTIYIDIETKKKIKKENYKNGVLK
jgi:antitoxin component YwqK of YwqJK toxin-antitoxin module